MRLSDIKGERVLDVLADLVDPVASIASDKEVRSLFVQKDGDAADRVRSAVPTLLRTHKDDLIRILATLDGVPAAEYEKDMTLQKVVSDLADLLTDGEFTAFLSSQEQKQDATPSGTA